jgi:hypothetical protein
MRRFYATAALWATIALIAPCTNPNLAFAPSPAGATDTPEKTVPQGNDPPGADNGQQPIPPMIERNGVIPPPPTGDEDIYKEVPNPEAGHDKEVIPPPAPNEGPGVKPL